MSDNPFDDPAGRFLVVANDACQYALWPDFAAVPEGWHTVLAATERSRALAHVRALSSVGAHGDARVRRDDP